LSLFQNDSLDIFGKVCTIQQIIKRSLPNTTVPSRPLLTIAS